MYAFTGGIPEWRSFDYPMYVNQEYTRIRVDKLSPDEITALIREHPFILDVRPKDFGLNQSYIEGAKHIPLVDLMIRINEIPRNRQVIVVDWAMKQSPIAAIYLTKNNYQVLGVLKGGMERWLIEQLPVEERSQYQ